MTYDVAVAALEDALKFGMDPSLEPIRAMCVAMGDPQKRYCCVQVAGTNGKSSTTRMIAALLHAQRLRVGLYVSPHLVKYPERIEIDGAVVDDETFARGIEAALGAAARAGVQATEFELLTAAALWLFAQEGADWAVLECGLGGRWDATSVVNPQVAVITGVALEHTAILGDTIEEIAGEKAGILKTGIPAVSAPQEQEAQRRLNEEADRCATSIRYVDTASIVGDTSDFSYDGFSHLSVQLQGSFQRTNAAVALEACRVLVQRGWSIDEQAMRSGLSRASWAGRFEFLRRSPDVLIDGAHNIHAVRALSSELASRYDRGSVVFCIGVMADKDYAEMLKLLVPLAKAFVCYRPDNPRALSESDLADAVQIAVGIHPVEVVAASTPHSAVEHALEFSEGSLPICFCGSLYGIASIKKAWHHFENAR